MLENELRELQQKILQSKEAVLDLSNQQVDAYDLATICDLLLSAPWVSKLVLSGNNLLDTGLSSYTSIGIFALARLLSKNPGITSLYLENCFSAKIEESMRLDDIRIALETNTNLRILSLARNNFSTTAPNTFAMLLEASNSIEYLNLDDCRLSDAHVLPLLRMCGSKSNLTRLSLDLNYITALGTTELCSSAATKHLRHLSLCYNLIGEIGALNVARCLQHPDNKIMLLYLDGCNIGNLGLKVLAQALQCNNTLLGLHINDNDITDFAPLTHLLAARSPLCEISLCNNDASLTDFAAFFQRVGEAIYLRVLLLDAIGLTDMEIPMLVNALLVTESLTDLTLFGNNLSPTARQAVHDAGDRMALRSTIRLDVAPSESVSASSGSPRPSGLEI